MPKADKVAACLTAQAVAPNPPTGSISRDSALGGGSASSHKSQCHSRGWGGLRRAVTCQRASVCESFLSHALRLLCPSVFPLRAHVLYFWPGGRRVTASGARTVNAFSKNPLKSETNQLLQG